MHKQPSAVFNITLQKYKKRAIVHEMTVLRCEEHKTSYSFGAAKLVIGPEVANM